MPAAPIRYALTVVVEIYCHGYGASNSIQIEQIFPVLPPGGVVLHSE